MTQLIFRQNRGVGNPSAYYVIDRRVPAMQVPAFYVTEERFATRMDKAEAERRIASNEELRNRVNIGIVTIEEVAA
jgi:hypothetical protein